MTGQIYSQLKNTEIIFNGAADYAVLSKKSDFVVIANGNANFTQELGCWQDWIGGFIRGATILGEFDPNELVMWVNKSYCKNGYAYLCPLNSKKATIAIFVPDTNEKEIDHYWEHFIYYENIKSVIVEEFKQPHKTGYVYPHKLGNIYLAGNAGGGIDPFLGFGQVKSIYMGLKAAQSIIEGKDYEKLITYIREKVLSLYQIRKVFDNFTDKDYDLMLSLIGIPGIKHLLYDSSINVIQLAANALKLKKKKIKNDNSQYFYVLRTGNIKN